MRAAAGSTKHPGSSLQGLEGSVGPQGRSWRGPGTPFTLSEVLLSAWARVQEESEASPYETAPSDGASVSEIIDGVFTTSQRPVPG